MKKARRGQLVRCYGSIENNEMIRCTAVVYIEFKLLSPFWPLVRNQSKLSLVAIRSYHINRTWAARPCCLRWSRSPRMYFAATATHRPIYFKNLEIIGCSGIILSVNESSISTLRNTNQSVHW